MAIMGVTETSAVAMDYISQYVQSYLAQSAVLIPAVLDRTADVLPGAKQVEYGRSGGFTAETKSENSPYNAQALTWATDTLLLNKHEGVLVELENIAAIQSLVDQEMEIIKRATQALVDKLEGNVYAALKASSSTAPDHRIPFTSGTTLSTQDILKARTLLNVQNIPLTDRFLCINPQQEEQLLNLEKFTDASKYGSNQALINGEIGRIYGFTVVMSNNVTADEVVAFHREHVAFARQQNVVFKKQDYLDNESIKYLLSNLYGLVTLDSGKRGVLINASGT